MIWACSRCKGSCLEVYPKEDKTIVYQGLCKECYYTVKEERISFLHKNGFLPEEASTTTQNNIPQAEQADINIPQIQQIQERITSDYQNNPPEIINVNLKSKYLPMIVTPFSSLQL